MWDFSEELEAKAREVVDRLSGRRLGFLMNFNVPTFKDGIRRLVV